MNWNAVFLVILLAVGATSPVTGKAPVPEQPKKPILRLQVSQSLPSFRKGQPLVFEGLATVSIHRPGPEHFKLTRVSDGKRISLRVAYDREQVEKRRPNQERTVNLAKDVVFVYNSLFKGTRLFLYNGILEAKEKRQAGVLDLYGCPELEPGVRYRLTWACWPVGAKRAVEVSCDFELNE